jgi:hypothetical protein
MPKESLLNALPVPDMQSTGLAPAQPHSNFGEAKAALYLIVKKLTVRIGGHKFVEDILWNVEVLINGASSKLDF